MQTIKRAIRRAAFRRGEKRIQQAGARGFDVDASILKAAREISGQEPLPGESPLDFVARVGGFGTRGQFDRAIALIEQGYSPDEAEAIVKGG